MVSQQLPQAKACPSYPSKSFTNKNTLRKHEFPKGVYNLQ